MVIFYTPVKSMNFFSVYKYTKVPPIAIFALTLAHFSTNRNTLQCDNQKENKKDGQGKIQNDKNNNYSNANATINVSKESISDSDNAKYSSYLSWDKIKAQISSAKLSFNFDQLEELEWMDSMKKYLKTNYNDFFTAIEHANDLWDFSENGFAGKAIKESRNANIYPEVAKQANVRFGKDLSKDEIDFLKQRRKSVKSAFAKFIGIPEKEINENDIPVIAATGSGGGYRALVATTGYLRSAKENGLFDCFTYVAGVSGSTWLLSLYYSTAKGSFDLLLDILKRRLGDHIASPGPLYDILANPKLANYVFHSIIEKNYYKNSSIGLSDIYGALLAARLFIPDNIKDLSPNILKTSHQANMINSGKYPMPICTCVRHEIPALSQTESVVFSSNQEKDNKKKPIVSTTKNENKKETMNEIKNEDKNEIKNENNKTEKQNDKNKDNFFQWFEVTPYEFGSDEIEAWIPTWALGREFKSGETVGKAQPEMNLSALMGIYGSAFCATLSHYYREIRPFVMKNSVLNFLDPIMMSREDDLSEVHPIDPSSIPNFTYGIDRKKLSSTTPKEFEKLKQLTLMDAGMSNNLAIYPFLRKAREVDILIAFDSSADIKDVKWLEIAAGYAKRKGFVGWPIQADSEGEGQAKISAVSDLSKKELAEKSKSSIESQKSDDGNSSLISSKEKVSNDINNTNDNNSKDTNNELKPCRIYSGKTAKKSFQENKEGEGNKNNGKSSKKEKDSENGSDLTVIYFPLIPNKKVLGVDPDKSAYMSTWNFKYTPEEIDSVIALTTANFYDGLEETRETIRNIYELKKKKRLAKEAKDSLFFGIPKPDKLIKD